MLVGIMVFSDVEVLDFAGPYEVFAAAAHRIPGLQVLTVGPAERVRCRGGLVVVPDWKPGEDAGRHTHWDVVIVPGGPGARHPSAERDWAVRFVADQWSAGATVASVCTGLYILAEAGIAAGRPVTTHFRAVDDVARMYPGLEVVRERVVDSGRLLTAGGVACGVDLALHLVARTWGTDLAGVLAENMEWPVTG